MVLPLTLALDTAQPRCQCALALRDGTTLSEIEDRQKGHAEVLIGQVDTLLARAGLAYADLERIAVTTGPGSFTGLRVGLSAARAFGLSLDIPVIGVPTLLAMSLAMPENTSARILVDARRDEMYRQDFAGPGLPVGDAAILPVEAALEGLEPGDAVLGTGAPLACETRGAVDLEAHLAPAARGFVGIAALARFAQTADPADFPPDPFYLRAPDAKPQTGFAVARQNRREGR
ncbi:tRNA (adenosine(37)-N6)-threonylcarbamoyltransferase complex dimerization subunit type 1 TsaB [Cucumibacter marinus]|uniref:tRNA (adenosine(37)-N6)-threonylcarbamoyltransferase complex dimerization subunit type 1 TsaB n=1 Tax=Cucumibacter marinus TaxID=1121252 RepID=UPI00040162FA|nr:tRNA (adenosine(37)-N6)-threonylcarbamoyltransferase complex dimerization subunit type 1 TsaB [Cucumibacter marinus]